LAQYLLLYTKSICFYRKIASRFFAIILQSKNLRRSRVSANSANFCKFPELLQKIKKGHLTMKMNKNNQTLRNQNAELHFRKSGPSVFAEHCITKPQKLIHNAKNSEDKYS